MARDGAQSRHIRVTEVSTWRVCTQAAAAGVFASLLFIGWAGSKDAARAAAIPPLSANDRFNAPGIESQSLMKLVGRWKVTETIWPAPGAAPLKGTGVVAMRRMVGSMLEETLFSSPTTSASTIARIDYLTYNRVEGHWEYVSMDERSPVGVMPAVSFARDPADHVTVTFAPFAVAGPGAALTGQLLRMDEVISVQGPRTNRKDQYFIIADGTGTKWLAHRYAYSR